MIDNTTFESKYSENKHTIESVTRFFGKNLSPEERKSAGMIGLMNALAHFKNDRGMSFKTYLTMRIKWECYNIYVTYYKPHDKNIDEYIEISFKDFSTEIIDILDGLSAEEKKLFNERFVMKYTNAELSKIYGITTEGMRLRVISLVNKIKNS